MTTYPEYAIVRDTLARMTASLSPTAAPVPPSNWERLRLWLRAIF
jgi:hypothetical protein